MAHQAKKNTSSSLHKKSVSKKRDLKEVKPDEDTTPQLERIAKVMARAGVASRRESERLIEAGRVSVNGKQITSPALNVSVTDRILVNGRPLPERETTQIWRFHKPRGCVTTHKDPEGRELAFDHLPSDMARVISVGRLDYNTEGLLLLTNDGGLARHLELPATGWLRRYRVRVRGSITQHKLDELKDGITVDGVRYGRIDAQLNRQDKANLWITVSIREGKNREIRRIFESLGMAVSRLIRISYGPFMLGDLDSGQIEVIKSKILVEQLGEDIAVQLGIPLDEVENAKSKRRARRDEVDNALKSKKPGNPKGGRSLNFSGKRKFTDRNGRDSRDSEKTERRQKTGRRSRNSSKALEARHESRDEKRRSRDDRHNSDDRKNKPQNQRDNPRRSTSENAPQNRKRDENVRRKKQKPTYAERKALSGGRPDTQEDSRTTKNTASRKSSPQKPRSKSNRFKK